jgi:hypothetical protein
MSTTTKLIGGLSALFASLPAVAVAAELLTLFHPTQWLEFIVPGGLLVVIALSLGAIGYLVACQVAMRLTASPSQGR